MVLLLLLRMLALGRCSGACAHGGRCTPGVGSTPAANPFNERRPRSPRARPNHEAPATPRPTYYPRHFRPQVVYASAGTALFFVVMATLEGHPDQAGAALAAKFWPTLGANYAIWPLVSALACGRP